MTDEEKAVTETENQKINSIIEFVAIKRLTSLDIYINQYMADYKRHNNVYNQIY